MPAALLATFHLTRVLADVGDGFREGFYMFWETLWALVFGFALSGAVQAFVSREGMRRRLGDHGPASVARASLYGMVSSSCSYAASAMARSLFAGGADFLSAMVFMFASTNLVVELGIVLAVLIGWQFVAAEFVGGSIMIVLLAVVGGLWLRGRALAEAHERVEDGRGGRHAPDTGDPRLHRPLKERFRSRARWSDAAGYAMSDLTMLRQEMIVGFTLAGFLGALVPAHVWSDVFVQGHGFWTDLENAAVGPFVAIISFVCSIGNVPLAAALWKGGISFGGTVSFIFADLITFPLLLIYRKQYGWRMAARMLAVFWVVMSTTGLVTQYLFSALGWVPATHPTVVAGDTLHSTSTSVLDAIALVAFAGLYWLSRHRGRTDGDTRYAKDPVCGMQVERDTAPATSEHAGAVVYFCSERCRDRYEKERHDAPVTDAGRLRSCKAATGGPEGPLERDRR